MPPRFQTDYWICGIAPFGEYLVTLAYVDGEEDSDGEMAEEDKSAVYLMWSHSNCQTPLMWPLFFFLRDQNCVSLHARMSRSAAMR